MRPRGSGIASQLVDIGDVDSHFLEPATVLAQASELFKLSKMTPMGKAYVGAALDRVELGGGTNLSAGLFHGIEQQKADLQSDYEAMVQRLLAGGPSPGSNTPIAEAGRVADSEPVPPMRAVLLLSDGQPTIGLRDTEALAAMMQEMLPDDGTPDQPTAVRVHTFGFGTDHDPHLLGKLAEVGRGNYYAIEEPHQVSQVRRAHRHLPWAGEGMCRMTGRQ